MNQKEAEKLIVKYNQGLATAMEKTLLENWYIQESKKQKTSDEDINAEQLKAEIWSSITHHVAWDEKDSATINQLKTKKSLWNRIGIYVAAAVLLIVSTMAGYNYFQPEVMVAETLVMQEIKPGRNQATLTLADGSIVNLNEHQEGIIVGAADIKYKDGSLVGSSGVASEKLMVLTTPKGGQYQVVLSDGTKVILNAQSTLKYPALFSKSNRRVELVGEAYFEVAKSRNRPFVVVSADQEVTVLGTHFNVNAYPTGKGTRTTLVEGAVQVTTLEKDASKSTILKPNQQCILKDGDMQVEEVQAEFSIAWKNGYFMFNYDSLEDIMLQLGRWYGIEIRFEDEAIKKKTFFGTISKYEDMSKVLSKLERTGTVKFEMRGNTLHVSSK